MESDDVSHPLNEDPRYDGEDTRLTSGKELAGWYIYGWAAEVFVICGIGSFIPITLEQLARDMGTLASDRSKACSVFTTDGNLSSPLDNVTLVRSNQLSSVSAASKSQCIIRLFGNDINTASFAMYTFSISVLIQAILIVSMSAAADHGHYRKSFLIVFAFTGAIATMLFVAITPQIYMLGALLAIVANTCFGASFVLLNSFLPILVRRHPSLYSKTPTNTNDECSYDASESCNDDHEHGAQACTDSLLQSTSTEQLANQSKISTSQKSHASQLLTKTSSYGIGIGYLAAVIVQTLGIFIVILFRPSSTSTTFTLRSVLFFIGLWWFVFTIPAALWLRPRPGPPLSLAGIEAKGTWRGCVLYIRYAWVSLGKTAVRARHLKDILLFLAAWFLLSDAIATVSGTAVLFAKVDLQMEPAALACISLIGTLTGVIGAFSWRGISQLANLSSSQTVIACICLFELIPLYGMLGFIPTIRHLGVLGLQKSWEMYPLGAIYGFVLGGLSSYCRGIFGELVPPGSEAAFFALYAITDKGSSVFGPAIVGIITDRYGEIRPAFVFLAVLIFVPILLMLFVDVERGKRHGLRMVEIQTTERASNQAGTVQ